MLNLSVFLVISRTSALTIRVAGVVRDWVVVLFSAAVFSDTKLTVVNLVGYGIGMLQQNSMNFQYYIACLTLPFVFKEFVLPKID